jgi:hypothetical protein
MLNSNVLKKPITLSVSLFAAITTLTACGPNQIEYEGTPGYNTGSHPTNSSELNHHLDSNNMVLSTNYQSFESFTYSGSNQTYNHRISYHDNIYVSGDHNTVTITNYDFKNRNQLLTVSGNNNDVYLDHSAILDNLIIDGENNRIFIDGSLTVRRVLSLDGSGQGNLLEIGDYSKLNDVIIQGDQNKLKVGNYSSTYFNNTYYNRVNVYNQNHKICLPDNITIQYNNGAEHNNIKHYSLAQCRF